MGASHGKEDQQTVPIPPPASVNAIRNVLYPPTGDAQANTLDRSLKGFLKKYNMSGLEYRLRLAGVYTLDDLAASDETTLSHHGFTHLMARRLFRALVSFVDEIEELEEFEERSRNQSRRQQQQDQQQKTKKKSQVRTSTLLMSRDNYGKRNKRRAPSIREGSVKRTGSPVVRKISIPPPSYKPTVLGATANHPAGTNGDAIVEETAEGVPMNVVANINPPAATGQPLIEEEEDFQLYQMDEIDGDVPMPQHELPVSSPCPPPCPVDDGDQNVVMSLSERFLQETPTAMEHHLSVPFGLERTGHDESNFSSWVEPAGYKDRSLSCPCIHSLDDNSLLVPEEDKPDELEETLSALHSQEARDLEELLVLLYTLLDIVKSSCLRSIESAFGAVFNVLHHHLHNVIVVEVCCRILKYLTVNLNLEDSSNPEVLEKMVKVVLDVIKSHPFSKRCQLNGCLVISNVFRSGHSSSIDADSVLSILSGSLENYQKDEAVALGILAAMVAVLASVSNSISTVSHQLQLCLEQLCILTDVFLDNLQLLQYILSFFTLSLINVAPLVDDSVMKSMMRLVILAVNAHKGKVEVVVCGCKTISQMAAHKLIEDDEISKELTDCLLEVMSLHPKSSGTQTWGSYALYQLTSYNNSLIPHVKSSGCFEKRQDSLPHLNEEARSYVEQLAQLATL